METPFINIHTHNAKDDDSLTQFTIYIFYRRWNKNTYYYENTEQLQIRRNEASQDGWFYFRYVILVKQLLVR